MQISMENSSSTRTVVAMRKGYWTSAVLATGLVLAGQCALGQDGMAGGGQYGGRRGGFGGGQPVTGTVTAATKDSVTLKTDAGDLYTVTATDTARITRDRQPIKMVDVKPGDTVTAMGTVDAAKKTVQAMMINDIDAATVQKAKDDMGKTYITGKVTAIDLDNAKVTVMRTDGVSQSITLDEGTSIQKGARGIQVGLQAEMAGGGRGGMGGGRPGGNGAGAAPAAPESITLADVKTGDSIVASGALKGGVFVPVKMGVVEAGAGGGRRRGATAPAADGSGPPAGPPAGSPPSAPPQ
jgi:hypothetical protein